MRALFRLSVLAIILGLLVNTFAAQTDPLDTWTLRNPLPTSSDLLSITFGENQFVAVGVGGTVLTSPDGQTWTPRNSGTKSPLESITSVLD